MLSKLFSKYLKRKYHPILLKSFANYFTTNFLALISPFAKPSKRNISIYEFIRKFFISLIIPRNLSSLTNPYLDLISYHYSQSSFEFSVFQIWFYISKCFFLPLEGNHVGKREKKINKSFQLSKAWLFFTNRRSSFLNILN